METTYTLKRRELLVQSTQASYTKEQFAPEGPLRAEALLARVTTQLDQAKQAYEALAYGNRQHRPRVHASSKVPGITPEACAALYGYQEMLEAYCTVTRVLQEEKAGVKAKHSLLAAFHARLLGFLEKLLLAWVERLSR